MRPETRYAKSGDVHIAYQVFGEGDVDVVCVPGFTSHLELVWEYPPAARFNERLGSFARVIAFDRRGMGLSDPVHDAPGARFVELEGSDHAAWFQNPDELLELVEEFVTGSRAHVSADRLLMTVLFTDVVRSTEQAAQLGDRRWRQLLEEHQRLVRGAIDRFAGREVNTTGDGFVAAFDGPARAIRCAQDVVEATRAIGLDVRAGVHTGECEVVGDDIAGLAVHIAARVAALADAGEILVSRTVKDLVAGSGIPFEARGEHELKGVPDRWVLYAVGSSASPRM